MNPYINAHPKESTLLNPPWIITHHTYSNHKHKYLYQQTFNIIKIVLTFTTF